jgi:hypothetical protein
MNQSKRWNATSDQLDSVAMWTDWQKLVRDSLPLFAADAVFLGQDTPDDTYERWAQYVLDNVELLSRDHQLRDVEFGARIVDTNALGPVTRAWLEAAIEIDFLKRTLKTQNIDFRQQNYIDIGAGYGRLASAMMPWLKNSSKYLCVDAVPISTFVCEYYTRRFAPEVQVLTLNEFDSGNNITGIDVAINIHSWNECSLEQIERWLKIIHKLKIPYLFTVQHNDSYHSWPTPENATNASMRPLLEKYSTLIAEEKLGLSLSPHALWKIKF